jgi:vancomycin resistance protein VanW
MQFSKLSIQIIKPLIHNHFRRLAGREFYILKRKLKWYSGRDRFAVTDKFETTDFPVFLHKSVILRQLKDVEMYLQENKRKNLSLAAQRINGVIIKPGETFSFWKLVGRPAKRKGYLEGLILNQGKIEKGIGGGLCQLGNLLFWIFAHSPLTITERHRHSFDVFPDVNRCVPFGAGATLSYNYIDLQVKNNTTNSFRINLWMDDIFLNGELMSEFEVKEKFRIEERNHLFSQQNWGGYSRHNQIFKITTNESNNETEELLVENHAILMYSPFLDCSSE